MEQGRYCRALITDYIKQLENIKEGDLVRIVGKVERNRDRYNIIIKTIQKI